MAEAGLRPERVVVVWEVREGQNSWKERKKEGGRARRRMQARERTEGVKWERVRKDWIEEREAWVARNGGRVWRRRRARPVGGVSWGGLKQWGRENYHDAEWQQAWCFCRKLHRDRGPRRFRRWQSQRRESWSASTWDA